MRCRTATSSLCLLFAFGSASAADVVDIPPAADHVAVWVNAGMLSRHFDRSKNFRENNYGLGFETAFSEVNSAYAGYFRNSDDRESRYFGWMWKPLTLGPVRLGFVAGVFDGYQKVNKGKWFPAVLPLASIDNQKVGVNFALVPTVGDRLHGAVVVQFKIRIW